MLTNAARPIADPVVRDRHSRRDTAKTSVPRPTIKRREDAVVRARQRLRPEQQAERDRARRPVGAIHQAMKREHAERQPADEQQLDVRGAREDERAEARTAPPPPPRPRRLPVR